MGLSLDWRCCFAALALRHNRPGTGAYQLPAEANPSALGFGTVGYNSYCVFIGIVYVFVGIALLLQTSDQNVEFPSVSITTSVASAYKPQPTISFFQPPRGSLIEIAATAHNQFMFRKWNCYKTIGGKQCNGHPPGDTHTRSVITWPLFGRKSYYCFWLVERARWPVCCSRPRARAAIRSGAARHPTSMASIQAALIWEGWLG
jgi:hypothetical protein